MKRLPRRPDRFDALDLYTAVGREQGFRLGEEADLDAFLTLIRASLKSSQTNDNVLHGKRVEALFGHVAGALGGCQLVKAEDTGDVFAATAAVQPPDYRLVLNDGSQMFVEVKNCHLRYPAKFSLKKQYLEKLQRYADMQRVPLKIAIFFSRMNKWCLLSLRAFKDDGDRLSIGYIGAIARSEMATLGDAMVATLPELRFELLGRIGELNALDADGSANITFRETKFFCAGKEITDEADKEIAFYLMRFGEWPDDGMEAILQEGKLLGVRITSRPDSVPEGQQMAVIGNVSSMISAAYAEHTVYDRRPIRLDAKCDPDFFELQIPIDHASDALPLLRLIVQPNWEFREPEID